MNRGRITPHALRFFLVLSLLLPFTFLLAPTLIAQGNPEPPWNPIPVSFPAMIYQPPLEAESLNDFLPPGYTWINATITPTPTIPVTVTLPSSAPVLPGGGYAPSASGTVPPPTVTQPTGSSTSEPTVVPTGTLPTTNTPPPTVTLPPITITPPPITTVVTLPESGGGLLFAEQQVAVIVEDPTFNQATNFAFTDIPAPVYPVTHTNPISNPAHTRPLLSLQLDTTAAATGQPISSFEHPVRLVVDLRNLTTELNPVYSNFWLAYRDPADPNVWIEVPITVHQNEGLISAEVSHFSEWASGVRPERWNPSWNPPAVSEFSGAATFGYPLELPPGRHGLQPSVALSYSSRGLDGRIQDGDQGVVADGWSMAEISIVRVDVRLKQTPGWPYPRAQMNHRFRLVLNGTGYELIAGESGSGAKWGGTRYYAVDAPDMYIELHDITASGTPRQRFYWSVVTADGMYYQLGYQPEAEESQQVSQPWFMVLEGNTTIVEPTRAGIAWHVDLMVDPFGNQMTYNYYTRTVTEDIDYYDNGWHSYTLTTYKNRIKEINYNYEERVTLLPPRPDTGNYPTGNFGSRVAFHARNDNQWWHATDPVTNIFIYHGDLNLPVKEYRLQVTGLQVLSNACENEDPEPDIPRASTTRVLNEIRLFTGTNNNPDDNDAGYALPAVTFTYDYKPHFTEGGEGGQPCFNFYYLTGYQNGYGGSITFTYTSDNRQVGNYTTPNGSCSGPPPHYYPYNCWLPYGQYEWPEIGYNYYVTAMTQNDGRDTTPPIGTDTTTTYTYTKPCYQQAGWEVGNLPDAHRCSLAPGEDAFLPDAGNILGFEQTTVTQKGFSDENLSQRVTKFFQHYQKMGQVMESHSYAWNGTLGQFQLVQETFNTYTIENLTPSPRYFRYVNESLSYQYDPNNSTHYLATKQLNQYNTAYQGGQQWGRLTEQQLYYWANSGWVFQHKQATRYLTRTDTTNSHWLILPYSQGLYDSGGTAKQLTLLYYDDATNNPDSQTLDQGELTLSRSVLVNSPIPGYSTRWHTSDTRMDYDLYGNATTVKSNTTYGEVGLNGSAWSHSVLPGTSTEQTTSIGYESTYNLYPISVTQAGAAGTGDDLTTTFQIYGFNGVALDGFQKQRGLLKQVTNANGTLVIYEYDPWGRLHATYDNNNDRAVLTDAMDGDPLVRYRYWDSTWNSPTLHLNPGGNDPFVIASITRPGTYPSTGNNYPLWSYSYFDGFGRVIQEQNRGASVDGAAGLRDIITTTAYNAQGQAYCTTVPFDVAHQTNPSINAFHTTTCEGAAAETITTYDNLARPLTVTSPGGAVSTYAYGVTTSITASGHNRLAVTRIQDANNHFVRQYSNALGQLALVREYNSIYPAEFAYADTRYSYDMQGNLVNVGTSLPSDASVSSWLRLSTMTYDAFGRKLTMDDPDMDDWSYSYDALGNLTRQTDAKTNRLCFYYDSHNRLDKKYHNGTGNTACPTTPAGILLADTDYYGPNQGGATGQVQTSKWPNSSNQDSFTYDSQGRLTSHVRTIEGSSYTMGYSDFDKLNRPETLTYPNNESVTMTYDREGQNTLVAGGTNLITHVFYNAQGQMTQLRRQSGIHTTYSYYPHIGNSGTGNNNGRLEKIVHGVSGDLFSDFEFDYDSVGNIVQLDTKFNVAGPRTDIQNFGYDGLNRLDSAIGSGVTIASLAAYEHVYAYDLLGNLQSRTETVDESVTTYDLIYPTGNNPIRPHAATSVTVGAQTVSSFSYDDNGNMTSRLENGVTYTQSFDVENRLNQVTQNNNGTVTLFRYDGSGQRTQTEVQPDTSHRTITHYPFPFYEVEIQKEYLPCGSNDGLEEALNLVPDPNCWVTTQTTTRSTYFLAGQAVATRVITSVWPGTLYYIHTDHLGSTSQLSNTLGQPVNNTTARYLPYGGYRTTPTADLTEMGYTGHHENREIGLTYMNARFYVVGIGRFASADTIIPGQNNPQAYNRYSYVLGNPINLVDPSGHCALTGDFTVERDSSDQACWDLLDSLEQHWGIDIEYEAFWNIEYLQQLDMVMNGFSELVGGEEVWKAILAEGASRAGTSKFLVKGVSDCYTGCANVNSKYVEFNLDNTFRNGRGTAGSDEVNSANDPIAARATIAHEFAHILFGIIPDYYNSSYMNLRGWHVEDLPNGGQRWVASNGATPLYGWPEDPGHHLVQSTALYVAGGNTWDLVSDSTRSITGPIPPNEQRFIQTMYFGIMRMYGP
jgi:RHS repeat-associated protein